MKTYLLVGGLLAMSSLVAYDHWVANKRFETVQRDNAALRRAVNDARAESTALSRTVQLVQVPAPIGVASSTASAESAESAESARNPSAQPPREQFTDDDYEDLVTSTFEADEYDPSWAMSAQRDADERLTNLTSEGTSAGKAECRGTMCKIELHFRDHSAVNAFQKSLMAPRKPWAGGLSLNAPETRADGSLTSTLYLMRAGMSPPVAAIADLTGSLPQ